MVSVRRSGAFELVACLGGGLVLLFIVAPLLGMVLESSLAGLRDTVRDAEVMRSIRLTLLASLGGTLVFSVAAVPFGWLLARKDFPGKSLLVGIIDLPVIVPHSTAGIALLTVLNRESLAGQAAERLGLSFVGHPVGIALAMAFVSVPFVVNASRDGFSLVPERLEKAAMTLGASPLRVFVTVSLPLARRSVLTGFIMMFARGLSEFGAVIIIAYHPMVTPVLIYERFTSYGLEQARGPAVVFLAVCLALFVLLRLLAKGQAGARG
jgi:molybdate/tungstate transport system permease protein